MSTFSANYSSLDEVWGDAYMKKPKKTGTKTKPKDPICELYEMGSPSKAYTETDLIEYVNSYVPGDAYSKVDYSKQMQPKTRGDSQNINAGGVGSCQSTSLPHVPQAKDEVKQLEVPAVVPIQDDSDDVLDFMGYMDKSFGSHSSSITTPMGDIALYIVSGIILIFMMDQFVKLGMAMRGF